MNYSKSHISERFTQILLVCITLLCFIAIHKQGPALEKTGAKLVTGFTVTTKAEAIIHSAYSIPFPDTYLIQSKLVRLGQTFSLQEYFNTLEKLFCVKFIRYITNCPFSTLTPSWLLSYLHTLSLSGDELPLIS